MLRLTILLLTAGLLSSSFGAEAPQEINDRYLRLDDLLGGDGDRNETQGTHNATMADTKRENLDLS